MDLKKITDFESKWEGNDVDPHHLLMILDASEAILKTKFPKQKIGSSLIVEFSKVVSYLKKIHPHQA